RHRPCTHRGDLACDNEVRKSLLTTQRGLLPDVAMSVPRPKGERAEWGPPRPAPFGVHRILTPAEVLPIRMQAMATRTRPEPVETLLNRELSHLEFHAR